MKNRSGNVRQVQGESIELFSQDESLMSVLDEARENYAKDLYIRISASGTGSSGETPSLIVRGIKRDQRHDRESNERIQIDKSGQVVLNEDHQSIKNQTSESFKKAFQPLIITD